MGIKPNIQLIHLNFSFEKINKFNNYKINKLKMQSKKEKAHHKADEYLEENIKPILHKMVCSVLKEKPEEPVRI